MTITRTITINKKKEIEINGLTFFDFIQQIRGLDVINKKNKIIPKYILFWNGYTMPQINELFNLKERTNEPIY